MTAQKLCPECWQRRIDRKSVMCLPCRQAENLRRRTADFKPGLLPAWCTLDHKSQARVDALVEHIEAKERGDVETAERLAKEWNFRKKEMTMEINADGYSISGCSIIYAPKGQAGEYARLATNPYRGCGHKCAYCYVPQVLHMPRPEFDAGATPRPDFLDRLRKDAAKYQAAGISENVLMSFTTDPYHPGDNTLTRETIKTLQAAGLRVTTLTKGGSRALRDLDLFRPGLDHFANTLTSINADFSNKWERGAASPFDRTETLKKFHTVGVFTWVSLEPVLDTDETLRVIDVTAPYVDFYKVGKANYIKLPEPIDWRDFTEQVTSLLNNIGKAHYIKKDLQCYLPDGYQNTRMEDL